MRSKAIVQCVACGDSRRRFAEAAYVRALLEPDEVRQGGRESVLRQLRVRNLFDAEMVGARSYGGA